MNRVSGLEASVARVLARDAAEASSAAPDASMSRLLSHSLLDWTGSLLAGLGEPASVSARAAAAEGGPGNAVIVGAGMRTGSRAAALANAVAGHSLDFDDVNLVMMGHPTAVAAPAMLALCGSLEIGGVRYLAAFSAACETMYRLSRYLGPGHYAAGWHATATIGAIGAAAGCACLLELDEDAIVAAIAIAASHAGGMKVSFGSDVKPLQVGLAAATALEAATLAARGLRGPDDIIEGRQGFADTHGGAPDGSLPPYGDDHRSILFKYHASCYGTQSAIEAGRAVAARRGRAAFDRATLAVHPKWLSVCDIAAPHTANEVKFSLRTTAALGIMGHDTAAAETYAAAVGDHAVRELAGRIAVIGDDRLADAEARLAVVGADGTMEVSHDAGRPDDDLDRQELRLLDKFQALAAPHLGEAGAHAAARDILSIDGCGDVAAVFEELRPAGRPLTPP